MYSISNVNRPLLALEHNYKIVCLLAIGHSFVLNGDNAVVPVEAMQIQKVKLCPH